MTKKTETVFVCQSCGFESPKWAGQCVCGEWNSFVEEKSAPRGEDPRRRATGIGAPGDRAARSAPVRLDEVRGDAYERLDTGLSELNRVLGGGVVRGSATLISGEPGIGKSTIITEAAANIARRYGKVLYVSGEESEEQIKLRADRVCGALPRELYLLSETSVERILEAAAALSPVFLIVDSIHTLYADALESAQGSVSQVRACTSALLRYGKGAGVPVFIVAHVTKTGDLAGPRIIEHLVDCVLQFAGERDQDLRVLRSNKNRFGATNEIGAFEMAESGLIPIDNLSQSFLESMDGAAEGAVATAVYEGSRPLLLELQALTAPANVGFARRTALGVEAARLNMILAVLERRAGVSLINRDVYVNVVGGLKPEGTSTDLAVALAVYSSHRSAPIGAKTLAIGEISLTGDLRTVRHAERIAREAARLGFARVILPKKNADRIGEIPSGLRIYGVSDLQAAIAAL
jgi:DNA repair protein RadA/Sms